MFVIVTGKLTQLEFVGPFATMVEAKTYAETNANEDIWHTWDIVSLKPPTPYNPYEKEA